MSEIQNLNPSIVWNYFYEITQIPRPSKHEARIVEYLENFAKEHSLEYRKDRIGNIVILKKAVPGCEDWPVLILQSHVDMVAEKNNNVNFNFETDPIQGYVCDDWVRARGTTLGADCGIGMAAELAVLASDDIKHGDLECLFTVDEETGLTGALELGEDMLTGKYLINLDSEDEGEIFIGCAGGIDTVATLKYKEEAVPKNYQFYRVDVSGLNGGHSGEDIGRGLGNSNKILARFLRQALKEFDLRLAYFDGGNLRNAIPREAFAVFGVPVKHIVDMIELFDYFKEDIMKEFEDVEHSLDISLSEMPSPESVMDKNASDSLIKAICGTPNGVLAMSTRIEGLVETSSNLASVKFKDNNCVEIVSSQRSSVESRRDAAALSVESVYTLAGAQVSHSDGYPGWTPDTESPLLTVTKSSYKNLFGREPKVRAIHAGLECGLFLEKYPWLEMISIGPTIKGVHSPDEKLEIASVDKFWKLLKEVIESIK